VHSSVDHSDSLRCMKVSQGTGVAGECAAWVRQEYGSIKSVYCAWNCLCKWSIYILLVWTT